MMPPVEEFSLCKLCTVSAATITIHLSRVTTLQLKIDRRTMSTKVFCNVDNAISCKPALFNFSPVVQRQTSAAH